MKKTKKKIMLSNVNPMIVVHLQYEFPKDSENKNKNIKERERERERERDVRMVNEDRHPFSKYLR